MSWGGQQPGGYGGYGQSPQQYGQPPQGGMYRGPAPQQQNPGYGAPPGGQPYGSAPQQNPSYGAPGQRAPPPGYGGAPAPASAPAYGQNPNPAGYGQGYGGGGQYGQPSGYGSAPPPQGGGYGGNFSAPPPPGVNPEIWTWFQAVDSDRSGKITAIELQQALMNGNWSPFNPETCRLMIGMFDKDRNGTIDVHEFAALWKYIQDWKACFDRFDTDRSGSIDANELGNAFRQFGYALSPQFSQVVLRVFDRNRGGYSIKFDDFIQACVMLKSLTDKFRVKDTNQNGMIQISYEEFLEMVLDTALKK